MNKSWFYVILAGFVEIFWVTGLKYSSNLIEWTGTILLLVFSFYLLIESTKKVPVSTAYAVFTGIGTAGTVITGILVFSDDFSWIKLIFLLSLLVGIIGLKLVTPKEEKIVAEKEVV